MRTTAELTAAVLLSEARSYKKYLDETDEKRLVILADMYKVPDVQTWALFQISDLERRAEEIEYG